MNNCTYTRNWKKSDGYQDAWDTSCGESIHIQAPIEVGFSPAPLPNAAGKYCPRCGKLIEIVAPKRR